jgi:hypothetical protein
MGPPPLAGARALWAMDGSRPMRPRTQAVSSEDMRVNACWLRAALEEFPASVPTAYQLADGFVWLLVCAVADRSTHLRACIGCLLGGTVALASCWLADLCRAGPSLCLLGTVSLALGRWRRVPMSRLGSLLVARLDQA